MYHASILGFAFFTNIVHHVTAIYQGQALQLWSDLPKHYRKYENGFRTKLELPDFIPLSTAVQREEVVQKIFRVEDFNSQDGEAGTMKLWQNVLRRLDEMELTEPINISIDALVE